MSPSPNPANRRRSSRRFGALLGGVAILAIAIGGGLVLFTQQTRPTATNVIVRQTDPSGGLTSPQPRGGTTDFLATPTQPGLTTMQPTAPIGGRATRYGDWQLSCDTPPGASFEQCAVIQNVTAENQPNVGLSVMVLRTADRQARLLRVLAPLGVLLPNGLGLQIDGRDLGRVAFARCVPNGCIAEIVMDDALIQTLSSGQTALFVIFRTPEEGIGIPVSLNGFSAGFAQLT